MESSQKKPKNLAQKNKATNDLAVHYWSSVNYFVGLIKASEIKAGLILSFYGILLNFIYQNVEQTSVYLSGSVILYILLGAWFICCMISIYFSIRSFIPRIESKYDPNVFFFSDIITKFGDIKEFSDTFYNTSLNDEERYQQLGQQIFINAKIAAIKFKNVNLSFRFMAIGLALLLMLVLYYAIVVLI